MATSFTTEFVQSVFRDRGAELLGPYVNASTKLHFRCPCGEEGDVLWSNLWYKPAPDGSPTRPLCKACVRRERQERGKSEAALERLRQGHEQRAWTLDRTRALVEQFGSRLLSDDISAGVKTEMRVVCASCTKGITLRLESLLETSRHKPDYRIRCKGCVGTSNASDRDDIERITKQAQEYLRKHGCTPQFDVYPGKNSAALAFLCSCPDRRPHTITWGQIRDDLQVPRCELCTLAARPRGSAHKRYNPDLTDADRANTAYGRKHHFPVWQRAVMDLFGYQCAVSGQKSKELSAHHLRSWSAFPAERYRMDNGVVISRATHAEFHTEWMASYHDDASPEDFAAFYQCKTGRPFQPLLQRVAPEIVFAFAPQPDLLVEKLRLAESGKTYLPFLEPEVRTQARIVNSMIRNREGLSPNKIGARKLTPVKLTHSQATAFFDRNHIQGHMNAETTVGLTDGDTLFSAMSFTKVRVRAADHPDGTVELARFANQVDWQVMGAASRLLRAFLSRRRPPLIVTYADRRFSSTDPALTMYPRLGFEYSHPSQASYSYTLDGLTKLNKKAFQRSLLPKVLGDKFDPALTEWQNMEQAGYARMPDCGTFVYQMKP